LETRKSNLVDELHWKTINHITKNNDFIFYGNITPSHIENAHFSKVVL
jgi:hypothetical protein